MWVSFIIPCCLRALCLEGLFSKDGLGVYGWKVDDTCRSDKRGRRVFANVVVYNNIYW